jgi:hypothetical protein
MSVKTSVEVDGELVAAVQRVLSTATFNETGMDLMDEDVMSRAWR